MNNNNCFNVPDIIYDFWVKNTPDGCKLFRTTYNTLSVIFYDHYPLEFRPPYTILARINYDDPNNRVYNINGKTYDEESAIKVIKLIGFI